MERAPMSPVMKNMPQKYTWFVRLCRRGGKWVHSLYELFVPRTCAVCGSLLGEGEECICLKCNMDMPRTNFHLQKDNRVERLFWARIPLGRASSFFFYRKGSEYCNILFRLKYNGCREIGCVMGRYMAAELLPTGFFEGMDVIMPVPLHPEKKRARGYNQSELLAQGVSAVTGLPVDVTSLTRQKNVESQTRKSAYERWTNVEGIFRLEHPERFTGKHVLLIDDVLTTGATTTACADAFACVADVCISILTLAVAD